MTRLLPVSQKLNQAAHWIVDEGLRFGCMRHIHLYPHNLAVAGRQEATRHGLLKSDRLRFDHMQHDGVGPPSGSQGDIAVLIRKSKAPRGSKPLYLASEFPECRAATAAWIILIASGQEPEAAALRMRALAPGFSPHPLMALCADQLFDAGGSIFRTARELFEHEGQWMTLEARKRKARKLKASYEEAPITPCP